MTIYDDEGFGMNKAALPAIEQFADDLGFNVGGISYETPRSQFNERWAGVHSEIHVPARKKIHDLYVAVSSDHKRFYMFRKRSIKRHKTLGSTKVWGSNHSDFGLVPLEEVVFFERMDNGKLRVEQVVKANRMSMDMTRFNEWCKKHYNFVPDMTATTIDDIDDMFSFL